MKENLISDKSLIYQWNFNDNSSVVDNPRVKATVVGNPTFKNGVCQFGNGTTNTTDSYTLKRIVNLGVTFSVSVKFKFNTLTGDAGILAYDGSNYALYLISGRLYFRVGVSSPYISFNRDLNWHEFTLTRNGSSVSAYLDGISQTINGSANSTQNTLIKYIGSGSSGGFSLFNGQLEYIKIWNRQLTPSEIKNNYTGKTYRSLPYKSTTLFHINSDNGVIRDLTGKTNPVNTNMTLKSLGSNIKVISGNGTNSNLALGSNLITGDLTFLTVINVSSLGEGSSNQYGMIFSNSKLQIWLNDSTNRIGISRDGGITKVYSNNNLIKFGNTIFLMITTTATGITNVYSCSINSNLVLASTSNLSAGSLVDTTHLTYIGDDGTGNRTFKGWVDDAMIIQGILTLEEGSQYVSSIKQKYI